MLNLYSVYSASNVRRLCALLCPAISFLHFHVLQIGPSISRPSFSRPAFSAPPYLVWTLEQRDPTHSIPKHPNTHLVQYRIAGSRKWVNDTRLSRHNTVRTGSQPAGRRQKLFSTLSAACLPVTAGGSQHCCVIKTRQRRTSLPAALPADKIANQ